MIIALGANHLQTRKPYNGSEGGNNDDFIDNFQEKLKGYFPKKNKPASLSAVNFDLIGNLGCEWLL